MDAKKAAKLTRVAQRKSAAAAAKRKQEEIEKAAARDKASAEYCRKHTIPELEAAIQKAVSAGSNSVRHHFQQWVDYHAIFHHFTKLGYKVVSEHVPRSIPVGTDSWSEEPYDYLTISW